MRAHGGCSCKGSHRLYTATALGRGSLSLPPRKTLGTHFYRRLSRSQNQSGHEGVEKIFQPSDTRDRTRAIQPVAKRLAARAIWPIYYYFNFDNLKIGTLMIIRKIWELTLGL